MLRKPELQLQIGVSRSLKKDMTCSFYTGGKDKYPVAGQAKGLEKLLKPDAWNKIRLEAKGDTFTVWLNGEQVTRYTDAKYAAAYSSFRRDNEKFGRMRVVTDLKAKGVHGDVIEKAVSAAYDEVNEEKLARDFLRRKRLKKPADRKQAARIFRQLVRAGFGSRTAFAILKKWNVDGETLEALEGEPSDPS